MSAISISSRWAAMRASSGRPMAWRSVVLGWMLIESLVAYRRRQRELAALERERARR